MLSRRAANSQHALSRPLLPSPQPTHLNKVPYPRPRLAAGRHWALPHYPLQYCSLQASPWTLPRCCLLSLAGLATHYVRLVCVPHSPSWQAANLLFVLIIYPSLHLLVYLFFILLLSCLLLYTQNNRAQVHRCHQHQHHHQYCYHCRHWIIINKGKHSYPLLTRLIPPSQLVLCQDGGLVQYSAHGHVAYGRYESGRLSFRPSPGYHAFAFD